MTKWIVLLALVISGCANSDARREKLARQVYRTCVKYQTAEKCVEERKIWQRYLEATERP